MTELVLGIASLVIPLLIWQSQKEADLRQILGSPQTPKVEEIKPGARDATFLITSRPRFKNHGFQRGYIDRVEVHPPGLSAGPRAKVQYVDRTPIRWLETREVKCEVIWAVGATGLSDLKLHYFDDKGREVGSETIQMKLWKKEDVRPRTD